MMTRAEYYAEAPNSYFETLIPENDGVFVKFNRHVKMLQISDGVCSLYVLLDEASIIEEMMINGSFISTLDKGLLRIIASESSDVYKLIVEDGAVTDEPQSVSLSTKQLTKLLLQIKNAMVLVQQTENEVQQNEETLLFL